ncbi:MAG: hypothetical protein ACRDK9_00710 [Solirubrobacterales bacterium]
MTDEVSRLYSLPLDEFTAERDAVARRLRKDGDREAADGIKKLRKPNRPAWAINQAVRADPAAAKRLVRAGERLDEAQRAALSGKGATKLRKAMADQQEAVEQVAEVAGRSLESKERSAAILDRVRETLRAVATDEELRAEFADGRLTRDREAVGFGGSQPATTPARAAKRREPGPDADATARSREAQRNVKRAERALKTAARRVEATEGRLDRARQAFDQAQAAHEEAEHERSERETELDDARAVLSELSDS